LGGRVEEFADGLKIYPSLLRPAAIETYDDHRMAMAFAVTGLKTPGVVIKNPNCTHKTFPDFFTRFFNMVGSKE
jgi:3-phosphoshikimate 1-carboxyvinyltransferase